VADASASLQRGASTDKNEEAEGDQDEDQEETNVSADVASSADLDLLEEDRMQDERTLARGFDGSASDVNRYRQPQTDRSGKVGGPPRQNDEAANERPGLRRPRETAPSPRVRINKASFFLDDEIVEMDLEVDPFELPSFEDAERLLQSYMTSCHNSFPFLAKKAFTQQFYNCT
jgi:hypothetical protein